jgi:two-component system chemotaxis sensor kinase CheA
MDSPLSFDIEADELDIFIEDVNEHLQALESGVLGLEDACDPETLNAVFRAAHTLKAVAGTVGHRQMAELTHTVETLFDHMRQDRLSPTPGVTDVLLNTVDALRALRDEVVTRQPSDVDTDALLARLHDLAAERAVDLVPDLPPPGVEYRERRPLSPEEMARLEDLREQGHTILDIWVTPRVDVFAPGARLLQAALALADVGRIVAQNPSQAELAEGKYDAGLWLLLATRHATAEVKEIIQDIADLRVPQVQSYDRADMPAAKTGAEPASGDSTRRGEDAMRAVRISVERLDALMNLVGELITERTRLIQIESTLRAEHGKGGTVGNLGDMVAHLNRVVDQLQQEVMQARMLPIANLFAKVPRLVRDVARAAGRDVDLVIEGEDTELDRSVIEAIGDPLIHLLRNAVDHGIESPLERAAAGKPATGTVRLTAAHAEGHILITVEDDGRGIDPARMRHAAVRRGLLSEEEVAQLDDDEAIALVFQPNLSTSDQVTGVSGRGVGMDVVQTNVKRIGGTVAVESEAGRGTVFRITLPLTLAIVQAMLVGLGQDVYAIPLAGVVESLYLSDVTVSSVKGTPTIRWREEALPLLRLREFFAHPRLADAPPDAKPAVVTVSWGKVHVGLLADRLIGKQEIVIKSLSPIAGNVPGLSGCTILGDGRVALIVDIPGLIGAAISQQRTAQAQQQGVAT